MAGRKKQTVELRLHPKQAIVFNSKARFRVLVSGRRMGKTVLAVFELIRAAKTPKSKIYYVSPTYRMCREIVWQMLVDKIPKRWIKKLHDTRLEITLINGSMIALKGADSPDALRGVGLNFVVLDECQDLMPEVFYTVLRPTLSDTGGGALFIGTPKSRNFLFDLYMNGQGKLPDWESWQFKTSDSPFIPQVEIESARRDMDPKLFEQEYNAAFITMSGMVYHTFDREKNVGHYPFNPDKEIWVGIDFNLDPMSAAVMQLQDNGEIWIVDEIVRFSSNTLDTCNALEAKYWRYADKISIFPDPSSNSRQHARGESDLDIFRERGFNRIYYRRKAPLVSDRINVVNSFLQNAAGDVKLKVDSSCKHVIKCFEQLQYKEGTRDVNKRMNIEHIGDGIGYCLNYLYSGKGRVQTGISL